jgi:hypothetical protein
MKEIETVQELQLIAEFKKQPYLMWFGDKYEWIHLEFLRPRKTVFRIIFPFKNDILATLEKIGFDELAQKMRDMINSHTEHNFHGIKTKNRNEGKD